MLTMSLRCSFACLSALTLQVLCLAHGTFGPGAQTDSARPPPEEANQHLNTSALNTLLAFEPYQDLASRGSAEQQPNILFSPLGLASAVALLSRVSGPHGRSPALPALLGLAADSTRQSVEDTVSALTDLLHNLTLPVEEEGGGGTAGDGGSGDAAEAGSQVKVWSGLQGDGSQSDYQTFLSGGQREGPSVDLGSSDKLRLHSYAYFKGRWLQTAHAEEEMFRFSTSVPSNMEIMETLVNLEASLTSRPPPGRLPFERSHTVLRSFQLNATASVEVAMMFRDDSADVMMLYDTNCSATVVQLAPAPGRLAWLLLLPKAELQTLEDCLSGGRLSFWRSNLKPG